MSRSPTESQATGSAERSAEVAGEAPLNIIQRPSPNKSSRRGAKPRAVIIHYDASPRGQVAVDWLCDPKAQASAHYHIDRDGTVTQMVALADAAWHAGIARIPLGGGQFDQAANAITIGIECANLGLLERGGEGQYFWRDGTTPHSYQGPEPVHAALEYPGGLRVEGWWEPWDPRLLTTLAALLAEISMLGCLVAAGNLLGHDEIAQPEGRKKDPGPLFPWDLYARAVPRTLRSVLMP